MTTAADLCQAGGTLVVLDFPVGARFGIDLASWATGERFLGVKMLPPGVHLIHVSAASSEGFGQPTSIFLTFRPGEVRTVRWDAGTEALGPVTEEEGARYAAAARSFALDAQLGPYPLEKYHTWKGLVSHLDATTLDRLNPLSKRISSTTQPTEPTAEQPAGSGIYYTTLDLRVDPMGLTPAEVTKRGMDKSYLLEKVAVRVGAEGVLGELQYAFLAFLVGQSYESFAQWKDLLTVLLSSDDALHNPLLATDLFAPFVGVLCHQLRQLPSDFLVSDLTPDPEAHFLFVGLQGFLELLQDDDLPGALQDRRRELAATVGSLWGLEVLGVDAVLAT